MKRKTIPSTNISNRTTNNLASIFLGFNSLFSIPNKHQTPLYQTKNPLRIEAICKGQYAGRGDRVRTCDPMLPKNDQQNPYVAYNISDSSSIISFILVLSSINSLLIISLFEVL